MISTTELTGHVTLGCANRPDVEEVDGGQKNFMLEEMKKLKEKVRDTQHANLQLCGRMRLALGFKEHTGHTKTFRFSVDDAYMLLFGRAGRVHLTRRS